MANEILLDDIGVAEASPYRTGLSVDKSTAQGITAAGDIIGDTLSGIQQYRTKQAATEVGDALNVAHGVSAAGGTFDPSTGDIELPEAEDAAQAEANQRIKEQAAAVKEKSEGAFRKINRMVAQRGGSLEAGGAMARTLVEREMRNIIGLTPGFEKEVRQAASTVMGFDPTGGTMQALFTYKDPTSTKKDFNIWTDTKVGKEAMNIRVAAEGMGVPVTEQESLRMAGDKYNQELRLESLQARAETGNIVLGDALNEAYPKDRNQVADLMEYHELRNAESGGTLGHETESYLATTEQYVNDKVYEFEQTLREAEYPVTEEQSKRIRKHFEDMVAPWKRMVEAGDWAEIYEDNKARIQSVMWKKGVKIAPELMTWSHAFGEGVTTSLLEKLDSVTTEGQYTLLEQNYPTLASAFGDSRQEFADGFGKAYQQILSGERVSVSEDPEVNNDMRKFTIDKMTDTSTPEETNTIYKKLGETSPKAAMSALAKDPQKYYELDSAGKRQFQSMITTNMLTLVDQLAASAVSHGSPIQVLGESTSTEEERRQANREAVESMSTPQSSLFGETRVGFLNKRGAEAKILEDNVKALNTVYKELFGKLGKEMTRGSMANDEEAFLNELSGLINYRALMTQKEDLVSQAEVIANNLNGDIYDEDRTQTEIKRLDNIRGKISELDADMVPARRSSSRLRKIIGSGDNE